MRIHTGVKCIGVAESALRDCKTAEQTVHRVLQDCPLLDTPRRQASLQEVPTTAKIWGAAEDLRRTIQFLTALGLRVYARLDRTQKKKKFVLHRSCRLVIQRAKTLKTCLFCFVCVSEEPETRDMWWSEIRTEIRSHARSMNCHAVLGYIEQTTIW